MRLAEISRSKTASSSNFFCDPLEQQFHRASEIKRTSPKRLTSSDFMAAKKRKKRAALGPPDLSIYIKMPEIWDDE